MADFIIISPQDWGDMWVSKHWISSELSKSNRVIFVGNPKKWSWKNFRNNCLLEIKKNLVVFYPQLFFRGQRRLFGYKIFLLQLKGLVILKKMRAPIIINFDPLQWYFSSNFISQNAKLFYCVDPVDPAIEQKTAEVLMTKLSNRSDGIIAISKTYKKYLSRFKEQHRIDVLEHGFDYQKAIKADGKFIPNDMKKIKGPIVGYMGSIHDYYVDVDLLVSVAKIMPQFSFVLVGPYEKNVIGSALSKLNFRKLKATENIFLLGEKQHSEVPLYISCFDVCMVLHNLKFEKEKKLRQRTPYKILQYFGQGKPVVSVELNELALLDEKIVYLAKNDLEFAQKINEAMQENPAFKKRRRDFAKQFSYEAILEKLEIILAKYGLPAA